MRLLLGVLSRAKRVFSCSVYITFRRRCETVYYRYLSLLINRALREFASDLSLAKTFIFTLFTARFASQTCFRLLSATRLGRVNLNQRANLNTFCRCFRHCSSVCKFDICSANQWWTDHFSASSHRR